MVAAALVLLCSCPPPAGLPVWLLPPAAVAIVGREVRFYFQLAEASHKSHNSWRFSFIQIAMSALREFAAGQGPAIHKVRMVARDLLCVTLTDLERVQVVAVSSLGKWKTALQMVSISLLLGLRHPG